MNFVWRGDVNDIHMRRTQHRAVIIVAIHFGNSPKLCHRARAFRRAADRGNLHAETFERFNVDGADKPGADDTGAKMMKWLHAPLVSTVVGAGVKAALERGPPSPQVRLSHLLTIPVENADSAVRGPTNP